MATKKLVFIVPQFSNGVCGVADYSASIIRNIQEEHSVECIVLPLFVGTNPDGDSIAQWLPANFAEGGIERVCQFLDKIQPDMTVVEYEPFGFMKTGALQAIVEALIQTETGKLFVFFHELYGKTPVWNFRYLRSRRQRTACMHLARSADAICTSNQTFQSQLSSWTGGRNLLPPISVISNIGEPKNVPPFENRQKTLVVFGGGQKRQKAYESEPILRKTLTQLDIERVIDIGPDMARRIPELGVPVVEKGILESDEIRKLLLDSKYAWMWLPARWLAKSGIYAAYAACGTVPVVWDAGKDGWDSLYSGQHFLAADSIGADISDQVIASIAENAYARYHRESGIAHHAAQITSVLFSD